MCYPLYTHISQRLSLLILEGKLNGLPCLHIHTSRPASAAPGQNWVERLAPDNRVSDNLISVTLIGDAEKRGAR